MPPRKFYRSGMSKLPVPDTDVDPIDVSSDPDDIVLPPPKWMTTIKTRGPPIKTEPLRLVPRCYNPSNDSEKKSSPLLSSPSRRLSLSTCSRQSSSSSREEDSSSSPSEEEEHPLDKFLIEDDSDIYDYYDKLSDDEKKNFIISMEKMKGSENRPLLVRVLSSSLPDSVKTLLFETLSKNEDSPKMQQWVINALRLPLGTLSPPITECPRDFLRNAEKQLEESTYGHRDAKHKLIQYLAHIIRNPDAKGLVIGIEGVMGVGKTSLIEKGFSKALNRPFINIPMSGYDPSFLLGHSYTYEGSVCGQIATSLIRAGVMNPILYFDEIDKIASTQKGDEVLNLFIQLTDPIQSSNFQDRYFAGVDLDLSKAIFVFSYNDSERLPPILRSRLFRIRADTFDISSKLKIASNYLIPQISRDIGFPCNDYLSPDVVKKLIRTYTCEGGVRRLRHLLYEIFREINLRLLRGDKVNSPVEWGILCKELIPISKPLLQITTHHVDQVGKINGLYACDGGYGGIMPIEVKTIPSKTITPLIFTGKIGPVMMESSKVAFTIAWSLISEDKQKMWIERGVGFHIHCGELSIGKEGPSATLALTVVLYSLLTSRPIKAEIAITGEMDFSGNATPIGGLREKICGAHLAKIKKVYYPLSNKPDFNAVKENIPKSIECIPVTHVNDIIAAVIL